MSLNRITIMGRLCADPELRRTQSGTAVASVTLAVDRDFKSQSGEKEADFIPVVAWKNTAEFLSKYFTRGRMAVVDGRLQMRDWKDQNGNNRRTAEVIAENVYFGDSKKEGDTYTHTYTQAAGNGGGSCYPAGFGTTGGDFAEIEEEGEVPF